MNYNRLNRRLVSAEHAAETRLRELEADWRMLKRTAREAMTPGRVVGIGLAAGFVLGKAAPVERIGGLGRLVAAGSAILNFAASQQAREAAEEAEFAAAETAGAAAAGQRLDHGGDSAPRIPTVAPDSDPPTAAG